MLDPAPALRCALAGLVLLGLTDCRSAAKRRFNATCGASAECDSGLCWEGLCTKSCTTSGDCGTGVCIEKVCKPIDRVECKADADCEKASPSNGCRTAVCAAGKCAFTAPLAGVLCGTKCEAGQWFPGQCTDGECLVSKKPAPVTCNDNKACTEDLCTATTGCTYVELASACDDNDACTAGDACAKGACTPGALQTCADGNVCTDDSCDKGKGCVFSANTAPCDDGDPCTTADKCGAGKCQDKVAVLCDDGSLCTFDECVPGKGCFNKPVAAPCDDGNSCTEGDACGDGKCAPGTLKACADGNPCTDDACDNGKGCVSLPNQATCSDGDACTAGDVCGSSGCVGQAKSCDDGNACTADSCQATAGCVNLMTAAPCDDGDACTTGDKCDGEKCVPGAPLFCDNSKPCLTPSCDKLKGCSFAANAGLCDDSEPCTINDGCLDGACTGKPDTCDDGNVCTTNSCVKGSGCVSSFANGPCNDGNLCTTADVCGSGQCFGTQTACDDKVPCTFDSCDNAKGGCLHQPDNAQCNGNNCVVGTCDATKGCTSVVAPNGTLCNQNDPCSVNSHCQAGLCTVITSKKCSDNDPCTLDSCDPGSGCVFAPTQSGVCDDGNPCTSGETCQAGACVPPGPVAVCDDTNPCTEDKCDLGKGCVHTASNASCDDLDPCSTNDNCSTGKCAGATMLWKSSPPVGAPYQAEAVALAGNQVGVVGSQEASSDYVKRSIIGLDLSGKVVWQAPVNASGIERPYGIIGLNGMWFVSGEAKTSAAALSQGFVRQHGPDGKTGWSKTVQSGTNPLVLRGITVSGSTICAVGRVGEGPNAKTYVARYNQGGGDLGNSELVIEDNSEAFAVAGYPSNQGFAFAGRATKGLETKGLVGRLTEGGQVQWKISLAESTTGSGGFRAVTLVGSDVVVAGEAIVNSTPQVYVARLDGNGNKLWSKILTPFSASHTGGIAANADSIALGVWGTFVGHDAGILLLDAFGNTNNFATSALPGDQKLAGFALVGDGTYIVHGTTSDIGLPIDMLLARVTGYFHADCVAAGACFPLKGNVCSDGDPCTEDKCTPSNGCEFNAFSDGTVCGASKTCNTGACQP